MTSNEVIERGIISGKMPGDKNYVVYFLELTSTHLHFFEGHGPLSSSRKHLKSIEIKGTDEVNERKSTQKNIFLFSFTNADGKYFFQCASEDERDKWIRQITKLRNQRSIGTTSSTSKYPPISIKGGKYSAGLELSVSQTYPRDSRHSVSSTDSGIGPSTEGEVSRQAFVAVETTCSSTPSSGDGKYNRSLGSSLSDGPRFLGRNTAGSSSSPENLHSYSWFWDTISRSDTEKKLQTEGKVGNFVVRINAEGSYVMSVWRTDAVHHYKIVNNDSIWKFERAAIDASGTTLVDLLDTYMKSCLDKTVVPFGDGLHLVYDEPWNPPEVDMEQLSERLRKEFTKSNALENSVSAPPNQKNSLPSSKPGADPKSKKTASAKSSLASLHVDQPKAVQSSEGSKTAFKFPVQSTTSKNVTTQPVMTSQHCKSQETCTPTTPSSESDEAVYQNWTSLQPEEDTGTNYENWSTKESPGDIVKEETEQIYENTIARPTCTPPQVPQKPMSKR